MAIVLVVGESSAAAWRAHVTWLWPIVRGKNDIYVETCLMGHKLAANNNAVQQHQTTPLFFRAAICSSLCPSSSRSTSCVCCPSKGGGSSYCGGVADILIGLPTSLTVPPVGCGRSTRSPRAW